MIESWIAFALGRGDELWARTAEHIILTGVSTFGAILVGIPLGVLASKIRSVQEPLTGIVGVLQTIPSLAMLAILLALTGQIGAVPAIIALTLYALLPIVRNTLAGVENVPSESLEAARALGMTARQSLFIVELPLALPTIIAGVRTAAVVGVGIATLSAFIGAGGLGEFINRGLALSSTSLILLGAVPAALLALIVDGSIGAFQWGIRVRPGASGTFTVLQNVRRRLALALPFLLAGTGIYGAVAPVLSGERDGTEGTGVIRVASKNFTEQLILGEMVAQAIARRTDLDVERRFNLGGTMICHQALVSGEIDMYVEYVGTALTAILGREAGGSAEEAFRVVREEYRRRFASEWMRPLGFQNTYALAVTEAMAESTGISSIGDLAKLSSSLRAGFPSEFMERPDGYPGLRSVYGLAFGSVNDLDPSLMYQALASGELDVISAFSTDGRIREYGLRLLDDDAGFFPPYHAAVVVRTRVLEDNPALGHVIRGLSGSIDMKTMQQMNFEVDENERSPGEVAGMFLERSGVLE